MNLVSGRIVEIYIEGGISRAKVSVAGANTRVPLTFLMHAEVGDEIVIESGVAISTVENETTKETAHVPSDSR
jgi:hydrogenase maturation factor